MKFSSIIFLIIIMFIVGYCLGYISINITMDTSNPEDFDLIERCFRAMMFD